jgi:hypothetical protein
MINRVKAVLLAAAVAAGALSGLAAPAPLAAVEADRSDAAAVPGELAWGTKFTSSDGRTICYCDGGNQCTPCVKF